MELVTERHYQKMERMRLSLREDLAPQDRAIHRPVTYRDGQ
jgi:hypothetical protein